MKKFGCLNSLPSHLWGGKNNRQKEALAKIGDKFLKAISLHKSIKLS
jgi:hypothetical protein